MGMTHIKIEILSNDFFTIFANEKNTYRAYCDDRYYCASFQILRKKEANKVFNVAPYFPYFNSVL